MANGDSPWDASYDPMASPGLSKDDPLRDWFAQIKDPAVLSTFLHDPERAKDLLAQQGISPPPVSAAVPPAGYPAPAPGQPQAPPQVAPQAGGALPFSDATGAYSLDPNTGMPIMDNRTGKLMGNLTSNQGQRPQAPQPPPVQAAPPQQTPSGAPVTTPNMPPSNTVGEGEDKTPTDTSAREKEKKPLTPEEEKQRKLEDALKSFSDSLKGVQAPKPPPMPSVSTPAVRSPLAIQAPQIAQLLGLTGNAALPSQAQGLARLLAGGRV